MWSLVMRSVRSVVVFVFVALVSSAAAGQEELFRFEGNPGADFGQAVGAAGDVNGDGVSDVIVGAPDESFQGEEDVGFAVVYSGLDGSELWSSFGPSAMSLYGHAVDGIGDVNQDGFDDFIVGAPGENLLTGHAFVYSGVDGSVLFEYIGIAEFEGLGDVVRGLPDMDEDQVPDFAIGASFDGFIRILSGADGSEIATIMDVLGNTIGWTGDINQDGLSELIVATGEGVAVLSGDDYSILHEFASEQQNENFGQEAVAGAGDVNADGFDDVIVGALRYDGGDENEGRALVFFGFDGSLLYEIKGHETHDLMGRSVSGAGDVNQDGFDDFLVGSSFDDISCGATSSGAVWLYSGRDGSLIYHCEPYPQASGFGLAVRKAGDLNQDGILDFVIGAGDTAFVIAGNDLYLNADHKQPNGGCPLTLQTGQGTPGDLAAQFFLDIDGVPFVQLFNLGPLDGTGFLKTSFTMPDNLDLDITFWSVLQESATGKLIPTGNEVVRVQP